MLSLTQNAFADSSPLDPFGMADYPILIEPVGTDPNFYAQPYGTYIYFNTQGPGSIIYVISAPTPFDTPPCDYFNNLNPDFISICTGRYPGPINCPSGQVFDVDSQACTGVTAKQKGVHPNVACPSTVSDPVDFSTGNNISSELDYTSASTTPLTFSRNYNSIDGVWRSNYSMHIRTQGNTATLVFSDGRENVFSLDTTPFKGPLDERGSLSKTDDIWTYADDNNDSYNFDEDGNLIEIDKASGAKYSLAYQYGTVTVSDNNGQQLTFTVDALYQPYQMTTENVSITYNYNNAARLTSINKTINNQASTRQYLYEDTRDNRLLTGIIDERGVRYATWSYDDKGRAVTSALANSVGKASISYGANATSVTNELGKVTTYNFYTVNGVRLISAIQGEPTANCPASNSAYTYDDHGLVKTKTDALNNVTTYTYNDRALETQRIEASSSSHPRTTTTEWDPSRFLRTKVAGPTHTTVYTYDAQGRQLTQVTTPNSPQ